MNTCDVTIDVASFITANVTPCDDDLDTEYPKLAPPTDKTTELWRRCESLLEEERRRGGVLSVDPKTPAKATSHPPAYIDGTGALDDVVVGLQTDAPLRRAMKPLGGIRMVQRALEERGETLDPNVADFFTRWRRTHNDAVFSMYTPEMRAARKNHIITGLPDTYGRGRILPDYRRVALYGVEALVRCKKKDLSDLAKCHGTGSATHDPNEETFRLRDEIARQVDALTDLAAMGKSYGFDITKPAVNAREAVQWTYFAYLAAVKVSNESHPSILEYPITTQLLTNHPPPTRQGTRRRGHLTRPARRLLRHLHRARHRRRR